MVNNSIFDQIRAVVKSIPRGKVLTYGDVAKIIGLADARKVGWALHGNNDPLIPCHRVVKKDGFLAMSYQSDKDPILKNDLSRVEFNFSSPDEQRALLEKESVTFVGDYQVDLKTCRWGLEIVR